MSCVSAAAGDYETAVLADRGQGRGHEPRDRADRQSVTTATGRRIGIPGYGAPRGEHLTINGRRSRSSVEKATFCRQSRSCGADTVAIAGTEHFGVKGIRRLIWELEPMNVELVVSPGVMDVARSRLAMRPIAGLPLLCIDKPQYQGAKRLQKRAFDFCFALGGAHGRALPILLDTAVGDQADQQGPRLLRVGTHRYRRQAVLDAEVPHHGRRRRQRTGESVSANESDGLLFKIRNDPRITPVGRFLRGSASTSCRSSSTFSDRR